MRGCQRQRRQKARATSPTRCVRERTTLRRSVTRCVHNFPHKTIALSLRFLQEKALESQKIALEKTAGLGSKIDIALTLIRIGLFFGDNDMIAEYMAKAEE